MSAETAKAEGGPRRLFRAALTLLTAALLIGPIAAVARYFDWLDARFASGPAIIGLLFWAIASLPLFALATSNEPPGKIARSYAAVLGQVAAFIGAFGLVTWALVYAARAWLEPVIGGLAELVFVLAFLALIAGIIKLLTALSDRNLIGRLK